MKKIDLNKMLINFAIVFICIQPIFDIKIFYNSISTLIRVIIVSVLFIYCFMKSRNKKKYIFFVYMVVLSIYFLLHHLNATTFTSLVPGNFNYSILKEILYFLKMLTPYLFIYILYKLDIGQANILKSMKIIVTMMSITIIISNIFLFSYGSYSDIPIKANFFSWFGNNR